MKNEKCYVELLDENVTSDFDGSVDDCANVVLEYYDSEDLKIIELLDHLAIHGLSINDTIKVYYEIIKKMLKEI